jgi:alkanesulfonate monooxygenase SsuD/methylene tetrahydromethanopterin reductase-like flavin-dependent oxidoreductase (luciferase family)
MGATEPLLGIPSTRASRARDWRRVHACPGRSYLARSNVIAATNYGQNMRFSVWPAPGRPVDEILDLARLTDDLDWFSFWFADHYMGNTGTTELVAGDTHEAWSILPAVAAVTSKIRLGPLVAPTSIHHPALLANRAATIDHLSGGRMVLGLGAGWQIN